MMKKKRLLLSFLILYFLPNSCLYAWNAIGHLIVGRIAYENLQPEVKRQVNSLIHVMDNFYPPVGFVKATIWADWIKKHGITAFNSWHYRSKPYLADQTVADKPEESQNVVWAIQQCLKVLKNPHASVFEKAFFLRFFIHLVADAHQPLHCINYYSQAHPKGDQGGNLFILQASQANNLHSLWDQGVGLFSNEETGLEFSRLPIYFLKKSPGSRLKPAAINTLAKTIAQKYPATYFAEQTKTSSPLVWCDESYDLGKTVAYTIAEGKEIPLTYVKQAQAVVAQRLALAGYRLAYLLNNLFHVQNNR